MVYASLFLSCNNSVYFLDYTWPKWTESLTSGHKSLFCSAGLSTDTEQECADILC